MTTRRSITLASLGAFLLLGLLIMSRPALAGDVSDANAFEKSATASTAAEHEALATYFRAKAAQAGKEVDLHTKMLTASMNGKNYAAMQPHCKGLISANQEAQKSYEELATMHSGMAKGAGK